MIVLGGGCFWCTEAVFRRIKGVTKVTPGYAGGSTESPTYEEVCTGKTGHAEVIKVEYDPKKISLKEVLDVFFQAHDPTQLNRQGNDVGTQYRSIILYATKKQKEEAEEFIKSISSRYDKPIETELRKLEKFYPAEDYHHEYYEKNRLNPYCMLVISPKIRKLGKASV
jgi:peptide-methionine (S)-S-oxide reductase